jgi:threonine dehydrogenase-like Zn-dependent dehydrogenase
LQAIRFHYRPIRYLLTRWAAARRPGIALTAMGCISLDEVDPTPLPGPEWVRIEPLLSGICGSDLAAVTAHDSFTLEPFGAFPFTFGHENVGRVVEAGARAEWPVGAVVVVNPMLACRQRGIDPACPACERGEYGLCRNTIGGPLGTGPMIGFCPGTGGGWAGSFVAHRTQLVAVDGMAPQSSSIPWPPRFGRCCSSRQPRGMWSWSSEPARSGR